MGGDHFHLAPFTQPVKDGKAAQLFSLDASNCHLCKNIDTTGQDTQCYIPFCVTCNASCASETAIQKSHTGVWVYFA